MDDKLKFHLNWQLIVRITLFTTTQENLDKNIIVYHSQSISSLPCLRSFLWILTYSLYFCCFIIEHSTYLLYIQLLEISDICSSLPVVKQCMRIKNCQQFTTLPQLQAKLSTDITSPGIH